jgi:hypothetical protein
MQLPPRLLLLPPLLLLLVPPPLLLLTVACGSQDGKLLRPAALCSCRPHCLGVDQEHAVRGACRTIWMHGEHTSLASLVNRY